MKKRIEKEKQSLGFINRLKKPSFALVVQSLILVSILLSVTAIGYSIISFVKSNKYKDVQAILFQDLESISYRLVSDLGVYGNNLYEQFRLQQNEDMEIGVFSIKNNTFQVEESKLPNNIELRKFSLNQSIGGLNIIENDGEQFLVRFIYEDSLKKVVANKVDVKKWVNKQLSENYTAAKFYILNKDGQLLFSNGKDLNSGEVSERALVQVFVKSQLNQQQLSLRQNDIDVFGAYKHIPSSNLVFFVELQKSIVLSSLNETISVMTIVILIVVLMTLLFIQPLTRSIMRPFNELVLASKKIANGDFAVEISDSRIREFSSLFKEFVGMGQALIVREEKIKELYQHENKRLRLESELIVAQQIQKNLITHQKIPETMNINYEASYIPASEVAGDWYSFRYIEKNKEFVAIIADVSGHGTGSSMFTAIVASLFDEHVSREESFNMKQFAESVNCRIKNFGKNDWHCTFMCIKFKKGNDFVEILNSGHLFPLFQDFSESTKVKSLRMPSSPAGMEDYEYRYEKLKISEKFRIFLYTDGLIEAKNEKSKSFGKKRLIRLLEEKADQNTSNFVNSLTNGWEHFRQAVPAEDDLCIMVIDWA